jgi:hypothetical protein
LTKAGNTPLIYCGTYRRIQRYTKKVKVFYSDIPYPIEKAYNKDEEEEI